MSKLTGPLCSCAALKPVAGSKRAAQTIAMREIRCLGRLRSKWGNRRRGFAAAHCAKPMAFRRKLLSIVRGCASQRRHSLQPINMAHGKLEPFRTAWAAEPQLTITTGTNLALLEP